MNVLEYYIYDTFSNRIRAWTTEEKQDIYAISFYIHAEGDDARRITVTLGYNTYSQWNSNKLIASSSQEARWNYAFWLQNNEATIGSSYGPVDEVGSNVRKTWLQEQGLWYSDEEEAENFNSILAVSDKIEELFTQCCIKVAQRLHSEGIISTSFQRAIPIIIHELDYYDEIAIQTHQANPSGLTQEFENWMKSLSEE